MASHFPADRFYKRHLDKKLHCSGSRQGQVRGPDSSKQGPERSQTSIGYCAGGDNFLVFSWFFLLLVYALSKRVMRSPSANEGKSWIVTEIPRSREPRRKPEPQHSPVGKSARVVGITQQCTASKRACSGTSPGARDLNADRAIHCAEPRRRAELISFGVSWVGRFPSRSGSKP